MIKISSNKYGSIQLDENNLKENIKKCLVDLLSKKTFIKILLEIKKNSLKKVEIFFKNSSNISLEDEKILYDQLTFLLSMRYGIKNSLIIFNYEN